MSKKDKKKTISFSSFSVDPRVYEMWVKYCEENGIENYSSFIEKVIVSSIEDMKK
jgi:hypothetical protein